jgi:hypothetical protein
MATIVSFIFQVAFLWKLRHLEAKEQNLLLPPLNEFLVATLGDLRRKGVEHTN